MTAALKFRALLDSFRSLIFGAQIYPAAMQATRIHLNGGQSYDRVFQRSKNQRQE
jgi:hypothetical protein